MASSTALYASGEAQLRTVTNTKADESIGMISGKKRKTVHLSQHPRPLFVAEAEFKAAKVFTRVKKCMLVLTGAELLVLNVAALEAADETAAAAGDTSVAVLRLVSYHELLEVMICGNSGLKIEFADTTNKPKFAGGVFDGLSVTAAVTSSNDLGSSNLASSSLAHSDTYAASANGSSSPEPKAGATVRVTYDSFTLAFKDPTTAQDAAAALQYHRAQDAAARQWLNQGLHSGLRCDPVLLQALPLNPVDGSWGFSSACSSRQQSGRGGVVSSAGAAAPPAPYPWGRVSSGWGCSVPLPASWDGFLAAAVKHKAAAAAAADEPAIHMEDLSCPLELDKGPEALQLTFSTPLGAAKAIITPQHVRAALLNSQCRQILSMPAQRIKGSSRSSAASGGSTRQQQQQQQSSLAGFSWVVSGRVPTGLALDGSSSNLSGVTSSAASMSSTASGYNPSAGLGDGASGGFLASHSVEVFAAVTVEVVQTPHTAGRRGAGRLFDPDSGSSSSSSNTVAAPTATSAEGAGMFDPTTTAATALQPSRGISSSTAAVSLPLQHAAHMQMAGYALLAALIACQLSSSLGVSLLQLLLVCALAALQWQLNSTSSSSKGAAAAAVAVAVAAAAGTDVTPAGSVFAHSVEAAAVAAGQAISSGSSCSSSEDVLCCGWSLRLVGGDVVSVPGQYLQLQIAMARADKGLVALRQRMASMQFSMSMGGSPPIMSMSAGVPTLVSDPEPAWLNADTKQRFLNAKPTLEASREQAQRTHRWRERSNVDTVLERPCEGFEKISAAFPTYMLLENSPDGHAVMMMKVGAIKDLCDLVFNPPDGDGVTLDQVEQCLALLNEYMVKVAAPNLLPAGFQVQLYDMQGFKLSYVMGDMITLFKLLVRFGHYYPERLQQALVINAPGWFSYPWKLLSSFLDANTSAKVVVVGNPKSALSTIAHHMGGLENVPAAWGGKNTTPLPEYPAHKRMIEFARRLNAGEQPLAELQQKRAQQQQQQQQ